MSTEETLTKLHAIKTHEHLFSYIADQIGELAHCQSEGYSDTKDVPITHLTVKSIETEMALLVHILGVRGSE